jgi:hypothetical protein
VKTTAIAPDVVPGQLAFDDVLPGAYAADDAAELVDDWQDAQQTAWQDDENQARAAAELVE